jgi:hypothetical protein
MPCTPTFHSNSLPLSSGSNKPSKLQQNKKKLAAHGVPTSGNRPARPRKKINKSHGEGLTYFIMKRLGRVRGGVYTSFPYN